jgi:hypothetical protein
MTPAASLRLAGFLVGAALAIAVLWWWALWPMLTRTGPAPGAGAQYVFLLLPTAALAAVAALGGATLAGRALGGPAGARRAGVLVAGGLLAALASAAFVIPGAAGWIAARF